MRFLTEAESREWTAGSGFSLGADGYPTSVASHERRVRHPIPQSSTKLSYFARHLEHCLQPRSTCLLWVVTWGVWPSPENWHLSYRLRQSYGDPRLLHEAPGHLFLDYEDGDLISVLEVAMLRGWDAWLLPTAGCARAFLSDDEFVEFRSEDVGMVDAFERPLKSSPPDAAA